MSEQPTPAEDVDEGGEFLPNPDNEWPNAAPPVEGIGPVSQDPNLFADEDGEA